MITGALGVIETVIGLAARVIQMAVLVYCVMSWLPTLRTSRVFTILSRFVEPIGRPFRPLAGWLMDKTGLPLDLSLWFALIAIEMLQRLIRAIL